MKTFRNASSIREILKYVNEAYLNQTEFTVWQSHTEGRVISELPIHFFDLKKLQIGFELTNELKEKFNKKEPVYFLLPNQEMVFKAKPLIAGKILFITLPEVIKLPEKRVSPRKDLITPIPIEFGIEDYLESQDSNHLNAKIINYSDGGMAIIVSENTTKHINKEMHAKIFKIMDSDFKPPLKADLTYVNMLKTKKFASSHITKIGLRVDISDQLPWDHWTSQVSSAPTDDLAEKSI